MKKKNTVLILGILSILILISAQIFIIRGIWKQKDEVFSLKYAVRSQEALNFINRRLPDDGFDTVRYILRRYSDKASKEINAIKDPKVLQEKKKEIFDFYSEVLNKEQDLSTMLSSYFERRGYEKNFNITHSNY